MSEQTPPAFELPTALLSQGFTLRRETGADIAFLMQLYASTRLQELEPLPWTAEQKQAFLASQFQAQHYHYRTHFSACAFDILEQHGVPIGRLYLDTRESYLHVVDIALLAEWRGKGIGTAVLKSLTGTARSSGKGIAMFVAKFNPALRLYRRLGFTDVADHGVYLEIEWLPGSQANVA